MILTFNFRLYKIIPDFCDRHIHAELFRDFTAVLTLRARLT